MLDFVECTVMILMLCMLNNDQPYVRLDSSSIRTDWIHHQIIYSCFFLELNVYRITVQGNMKACFHKQGKCRADFPKNIYRITMCENAKACFHEPYKCRVVFP